MHGLYWILFAVAVLAGVAYYMKWFRVSTWTDAFYDKANVELTVDKGKFKDDVNKATAKAEDLGAKVKESVSPKP